MRGKHTSRLAWLFGLVPAIAVLEIALQWYIPRTEPGPEDWKSAVSEVTRLKGRHDLVTIAPDWASPVGRMYLGYLISSKDFGRFDTTQYDRIIEVSENGVRSEETEGLRVEEEKRFGRVAVRVYGTGGSRSEILYDFVERYAQARFSGYRGFRPRFLIDHRFQPRLAIPVPLRSAGVSLTYDQVPLEGVVRGYGLIGRLSGEFDRGGPVVMTVSVHGNVIGRAEFTNLGPNRPFSFDLPGSGVGSVRFEFSARSFWDREFGFAADVRRRSGGAR